MLNIWVTLYLAVLYRKTLSSLVRFIDYGDKRLLGFEIACETIIFLIINVYFPYECHANFF